VVVLKILSYLGYEPLSTCYETEVTKKVGFFGGRLMFQIAGIYIGVTTVVDDIIIERLGRIYPCSTITPYQCASVLS
jgi:hypothetical protein